MRTSGTCCCCFEQKVLGDLGLDNVYMQDKLVRPSSGDFLLEYLSKYR